MVEKKEVKKRSKKTRICPKCGLKVVIEIIYGLPSFEGFELAEAGKVILGGCVISEDSPRWHCKKCGHEFDNVLGENIKSGEQDLTNKNKIHARK
jgi:rubredoxin